MVNRLLGPLGGKLMSIGVMLSTLGAINSNLLLGPRVSFAMGRDRVFFSKLGDVHARYRTPALAIGIQALLGALLVVLSAVLVETVPYFREKSIFSILTNAIIFVSSIFYVLAVAAVIILRRKRPDLDRPYRTLGYPVVPIVYIVFYCWFLVYIFKGQPMEAMMGFALILLGVPAYLYWRRSE